MIRIQACDRILHYLKRIHPENGFNLSFKDVFYWRDQDTEFKSNVLVFRDLGEDYLERNLTTTCTLHLEIEARVFPPSSENPGVVGNLALQDITSAFAENITLGIPTGKLVLSSSEKDVLSESKTVVSLLVNFDFIYKIKGLKL